MMVKIGDIATFPNVKPDKAQVIKIAEETLEVFSAWENWEFHALAPNFYTGELLNECADVIQATSNLIAALGVEDFTPYMQDCEDRNRERGRL